MRWIAIGYAIEMGKAAGIPGAERLLPERTGEAVTSTDLPPEAKARVDGYDRSPSSLAKEQREIAWKLSVELRAATAQLVSGDADARRERLESLADSVSGKLKEVLPTPGGDPASLEGIALGVLASLGEVLTGGPPEPLAASLTAAGRLEKLARHSHKGAE